VFCFGDSFPFFIFSDFQGSVTVFDVAQSRKVFPFKQSGQDSLDSVGDR